MMCQFSPRPLDQNAYDTPETLDTFRIAKSSHNSFKCVPTRCGYSCSSKGANGNVRTNHGPERGTGNRECYRSIVPESSSWRSSLPKVRLSHFLGFFPIFFLSTRVWFSPFLKKICGEGRPGIHGASPRCHFFARPSRTDLSFVRPEFSPCLAEPFRPTTKKEVQGLEPRW